MANKKLSPTTLEEKTRIALETKCCGSLSGWNCTFYLRIVFSPTQRKSRGGGGAQKHIVFELCKAAEEESVIN